MKNTEKIIIYDDACPMCAAYTNLFVKLGFIKKENRLNFSTMPADFLQKINLERSKNEIPIIEKETSNVFYGIDGLLEILDDKIPFIKQVANLRPIKYLLQKLYKFISYNRRVIVATNPNTCNFNCTPQFSRKYRWLFIVFFLLVNTLLLSPLNNIVFKNSFLQAVTNTQLQIGHFFLVFSNFTIAAFLPKQKAIEYLGQVTLLAIILMLLLLPLILLNSKFNFHQNINHLYFVITVIFLFFEYLRRMKYAEVLKSGKCIPLLNGFSILLFMLYLLV